MKASNHFIASLFGFCVINSVLAFWTWRNLDFWVEYVKGHSVDTSYWAAFLATLLLPLSVTFNIVSEIVRLFV